MALYEKLLDAISQKNYTQASELLRQTACTDSQVTTDQYQDLLHQACYDDQLEFIQLLVETFDVKPNSQALWIVIWRGQLEIVKYLVFDGVCKPTTDHLGASIRGGHLKIVKWLVDNGGCKPTNKHLVTAIQRGHSNIVKYLVVDGECKPTTEHLNTAILLGHFDIVKYLVDYGGCNPTNEHLNTVILLGYFDIVKYLVVDGGCKPSAMHFDTAIRRGYFDIVKYLVVDGGYKPTTRHIDYAIQMGQFDIVKWLVVDGGCKPTTKHIDYAIQMGQFDIVKWLVVDGGASTDYLDTAIQMGQFNVVKCLVDIGCKPTTEHLLSAIKIEHLDIVNCLIIDGGCKPTSEHLDIVIQGRHDAVVSYLVVEGGFKPTAEQLYTAVENNSGEIANFLIASGCIDLNSRVDPNQRTVLHVACVTGRLGVVECLIINGHCNIGEKDREGNTALHLACYYDHYHIVVALLHTGKCDVNVMNVDNNVPLDHSNNPKVIRELIKYGANPSNVYRKFGSVLGNSPRQPIEAPVKVFVTGDPCGGKSTLTKSLQKEISTVARVFSRPKKVSDVDEKTAGIIPYHFDSKQYGSVIFYDLAGQREFYSSHAAVLSSTICSSPPTFLLVIDLQKNEEELKQSILYWLSFLENQCSSVNGKPHVVIIGSHADVLKSRGEDHRQKGNLVRAIVHHLGSTWFEFSGFIPIDCRYPQSSNISRLRHKLDVSCRALRVTSTIQFNCHCLLVYLVDRFSNCPLVTLQQVKDKMLCVSDKNSPSNFVPLNMEIILSMCEQLYDRGHIMFLKNKTKVEDSWIIIDKEPILSEVTGTVFAPEGFKQHCKLASSTGVVPLSEIVRHFPNHNSDMLISFFTHLEYCQEISDQETLELIEIHQSLNLSYRVGEVDSNGAQSSNPPMDQYFLFSGLVTINRPDQMWNTDSQFRFKCGWMLQCSRSTQFFSSRFLQVLLLRIAFAFALSSHKIEVEPDVPALQRKCSIWRNGIFWGDRNGVEVLMEVVEHKTVIVLMRSQHVTGESLQLRSSIINKVLKTATDICPRVSTTESFIKPSETLQYPIDSVSELTYFSISEVAVSVSSAETAVVSTTGKSLPLESLLTFEPYAKLSPLTLHRLFDKSKEEETATEDILTEIAPACCEINPEEITHHKFIRLQQCLNKNGNFIRRVDQEFRGNSVHRCFLLLQTCKDQTAHPTLLALRRVLDKHSVFGGRDPMELGGVGFYHSDTPCEAGGGEQETKEREIEPRVMKEDKLRRKEDEGKEHREVVHYRSLTRYENSEAKCQSLPEDDQIHPCSVQHDTSSLFFVPEDLGFLMESLCQAAPQWYYIGLQMGVHPTDLDNISHNISLLPDSPKSFLREMLKTWLSPQTGSLQALLSALKSEIVRESRLANSMERKSMEYLERKHQERDEEDVKNKLQKREDVVEISSYIQVPGLRARALYDYQAACEDDISFDVDDIIENIEQVFEEWWMGEVNGERGLFPANHVQLI